MITWIGGIWLSAMLLALGLALALRQGLARANAVRRRLKGLDRTFKPCILIVDDDPLIRGALADLLQHLGYATAEAEGGLEALPLARRLRPSAVLMDLMMPEMDGYTAARQLKSDPALAGIPIAAFSATEPSSLQWAARAAGMSTFLEKPLAPDRLEQAVRELIERN